ncbi:MAG: AraC family transcriptional regulator [Desulfomonilaceae bacterium]|nr:AraC family transcriptional regulator [Desulfomonilaceae bacterium]
MCKICGNPDFDFRYVSGDLPSYIRNDISRHPLRSGIQVNIRDHAAHAGLTEEWEVHSRTLLLDFVVSGEYSCRIHGDGTTTHKGSGSSSIGYLFGHKQKMVWQSDRRARWVGILVDRSVMLELLRDGINQVVKPFDRLLRFDLQAAPLYVTTTTTPYMQSIVHQLLNCPYEGEMARLFIESKALELLLLKLSDQVVKPNPHDGNLTCIEKDKVFHARDILRNSMDEVTSLHDLAGRVGMSETSLKNKFKQLFGVPVFEYLREHRLRAAYEMLVSREWNVSQAAVQVGYSSLSHFSQAFRRRFGVSPSTVGRRKCRCPVMGIIARNRQQKAFPRQ